MISRPTLKAERSALMYDQLQTIRTHGPRNSASLPQAMLRDPPLLLLLDDATNTRRMPNENMSRALLEYFTIGAGHYKEVDVKSMARILNGHSVAFGGDWRYLMRTYELDAGPNPIRLD